MAHEKISGADTGMVSLRLICGDQPVGQAVQGLLLSQSNRSLVVELATPFLANQHIMMTMPDDSACKIEASFPDVDRPAKIVEVLRLNKEIDENSEKSRFVVELGYIKAIPAKAPSKIWAPFRRKTGQLIRGGEDF